MHYSQRVGIVGMFIGFKNEINKVWDDLTFTLADLSGHELYITGHSLGANGNNMCV